MAPIRVEVRREAPAPPPVKEIVVTLDEENAGYLLGYLLRARDQGRVLACELSSELIQAGIVGRGDPLK